MAYIVRENFREGDLVSWKDGMKNIKWPAYGKPAVVLEIRDGQRASKEDSGSCYWQEPNDVRIGILQNDGDFAGWWVDGNRLKLYEE